MAHRCSRLWRRSSREIIISVGTIEVCVCGGGEVEGGVRFKSRRRAPCMQHPDVTLHVLHGPGRGACPSNTT